MFLLFCLASQFLMASPVVQVETDKPIIDLTKVDWEYVAFPLDREAGYMDAMGQKKWGKINVGSRWELQGHPELNHKAVWIKIKFFVPKELENKQMRFFATAIDDEGNFYVNGKYTAQVKYKWHIVATYTDIDLSPNIEYGKENTLVIQVIDYDNTIRTGGILGTVMLYSTLPFSRTGNGGLKPEKNVAANYSVVLNAGDALLSRGTQTSFSSYELTSTPLPSYILRNDEAIILTKANLIDPKDYKYRVDLENVNPVIDNRLLDISVPNMPKSAAQYSLMKWDVDLKASYTNPFAPDQVNLQAIILTPSNVAEKVPGYFFQDFDRVVLNDEEEILLPKKCNPWIINYRPREVGTYQIEIVAQDKSGIKILKKNEFQVNPSDAKGFLHVSKKDPKYFEFDNGDSFFGIGPSGWYRGPKYIFGGNPRWVSTSLMDKYYERKAANNSSYEYLATFHYGKILTGNGFIDQHVMWKLDHTVRKMEELGIYWAVFHDDIRRYNDFAYSDGFRKMPYNVKQGGSANDLMELYFNEKVMRMQKDQLRYFVSRLSDSPAIWVWNCGDELQPGDQESKNLVRTWIIDIQNYIRNIDVYHHPQAIGEGTESLKNGGDAIFLGGWYITDKDNPNGQCEFKNQYDIVAENECLLHEAGEVNAPLLNTEGGLCEWNNNYYISGEKWDFKEMIPFHQHLWFSFFKKSAAGGTEWLCNVFDRDNQWYHAKAFSEYIKNESLTRVSWEMVTPESTDKMLRAFGLISDTKTLVWLDNANYTWYNAGYLKKEVPAIIKAIVQIPVYKSGNYLIEYWNTRSGKIEKTENVKSLGTKVEVKLPDVEKDLAIKAILLIN